MHGFVSDLLPSHCMAIHSLTVGPFRATVCMYVDVSVRIGGGGGTEREREMQDKGKIEQERK